MMEWRGASFGCRHVRSLFAFEGNQRPFDGRRRLLPGGKRHGTPTQAGIVLWWDFTEIGNGQPARKKESRGADKDGRFHQEDKGTTETAGSACVVKDTNRICKAI